jgi:hypothetical protein
MTDGGGNSLIEETAAVSTDLGKMSAEVDRRGLTRVGFHIQAVIEHRHGTVAANVADLSLHGMGIVGCEPLPVCAPVEVTIALLEASPDFTVQVSGKVVRADTAGLGIEFGRIGVDSFALLRQIITYNTGEPDRVMEEFCAYMENRQRQ